MEGGGGGGRKWGLRINNEMEVERCERNQWHELRGGIKNKGNKQWNEGGGGRKEGKDNNLWDERGRGNENKQWNEGKGGREKVRNISCDIKEEEGEERPIRIRTDMKEEKGNGR